MNIGSVEAALVAVGVTGFGVIAEFSVFTAVSAPNTNGTGITTMSNVAARTASTLAIIFMFNKLGLVWRIVEILNTTCGSRQQVEYAPCVWR